VVFAAALLLSGWLCVLALRFNRQPERPTHGSFSSAR
jgi:hypothetical protein